MNEKHHMELVCKPIHFSTFKGAGYPKNLLYCIYDKEVNVTDEMVSGLEYLLKKLCTERDANIIILKFKNNKTNTEISKMFGISSTRVSEITRKFIQQLRSTYFSYIDKGLSATLSEIDELTQQENIFDYPIEMMDLSRRAKNCLRRTSFKTAGELSDYINNYSSDTPWYNGQFRNLGNETAKEIITWLNEHGLKTKDDSVKRNIPSVKTFVFKKFSSANIVVFEVDGDEMSMRLSEYDIPDIDTVYLNTYTDDGTYFVISSISDITSKQISWRYLSRLISVVLSRDII